ncbi:MAG: hypothetical protein FWH28_04380, partial [Clostridiales bacterium]|nr:hypothetical protein [Clostridiales bacterium]
MEMNQLAQLVMEIQQGAPVTGIAGRERHAALGGDGFTQIFLQLMNNPEEAGLYPDLMGLVTQPEEEDNAGKKSLHWEMLMAILDMAPRELDFRQFALQGTEAGTAPAPERIQAVPLAIADARRLLLTAEGFRERFTAEAFAEDLTGMLAMDGDAIRQVPQPVAELAPDTGETEAKEGAGATSIAWETEFAGAADQPVPRTDLAGERGFAAIEDADNTTVLVKVIGYRAPEESRAGEEELWPGQEQFRQAIQEAKHRLADKENKADAAPKGALPVENHFIAQMAGLRVADSQAEETPGIPDQILLRLSGNLSAGRGEFVMKLIPEGLGEIT